MPEAGTFRGRRFEPRGAKADSSRASVVRIDAGRRLSRLKRGHGRRERHNRKSSTIAHAIENQSPTLLAATAGAATLTAIALGTAADGKRATRQAARRATRGPAGKLQAPGRRFQDLHA